MIRSFRSKVLAILWETGRATQLDKRMVARLLRRLETLDQAATPDAMNLPGFNFHVLKGHKPIRYTVHINGPWCITFEFNNGDAARVDIEQYH